VTTDGPQGTDASSLGRGLANGFAAYGLWGVLPLFFLLLRPAGPIEIVAFRILFSLVFCAVLLLFRGRLREVLQLLRDRRLTMRIGVAGAFIVVNWTTFIFATVTGHVVEAALGYFINPIVTVLLAVVILRERLKPVQWVAVAISVVAVVVIAVGYGRLPWVSLLLAFSFGLYGLMKKQIGARVDSLASLSLETLLMAPFALAAVIVVYLGPGLVFGTAGVGQAVAVVASGVVTAVPLLFFASAARMLPLSTLGLTQYLTPVLQLVVGVALLHEPMSTSRWAGFALIWVSLIILAVNAFRRGGTGTSRRVGSTA